METDSKYISLKAAAELYGYTRDHLGLMIRRNKLKGIKLGSYYVTTSEWMADYIKNFADPGHPTVKNKLSNKFLTEILASSKSVMSVAAKKRGSIIKEPARTLAVERVEKNVVKERDAADDLGKRILEELKQYKLPVSADSEALKDDVSQAEMVNSSFSSSSYVILPIRKMEDIEHEEVFKKIG